MSIPAGTAGRFVPEKFPENFPEKFIPGSRPARLAVLGSTRGTTMGLLLEHIAEGRFNGSIEAVLSNRKNSSILKRAEAAGIQNFFLSPAAVLPVNSRTEREAFDREISRILEGFHIDLILLIGFMRILSPWFCEKWQNRVLNVHPSLLPEFAGGMDTDVHEEVLHSGKTETGCTVHLVTPELDRGPILVQKRCPVLPGDTPETLKNRVQILEAEAFITSVELFVEKNF